MYMIKTFLSCRYRQCCIVAGIVGGIAIAIAALVWLFLGKPTHTDLYLSHLKDLYKREPEVPTIQVLWRNTNKKLGYIEPSIKEAKPLHGEEHLGVMGLPVVKKELSLVDVFGNVEVGGGNRVIVQGKPGSGKTTLLQKLTKMWMNHEILTQCKLFLKVQLRRSSNKNITCFVSKETLYWDLFSLCGIISNPSIDLNVVINEVKLEEICIALDGLDEFVPHDHLTDPDSLIYRMITGEDILPLSTVIVTSRPTALHESFLSGSLVSRRIEIVGFNKAGVRSFVHSYFNENKSRAAKLIEDIEGTPDILFSSYNPLLLTFLVYAFDLGEKLPQTETGIHIAFITAFLKEEVKRIDRKNFLKRECRFLKIESFENVNNCSLVLGSRFRAVSKLAYEGVYEAMVTVMSSDGRKYELPLIKTDFPWTDVPDELLQDSFGLLSSQPIYGSSHNPHGMSEVHSFLHVVIQEFLAAFYVTQMHPAMQKLVIENAVGHQSMAAGRYYCGLLGTSLHDESLLQYYVSVNAYGDAIDCAFQSQSASTAANVILTQNSIFDCLNVFVMEWPIDGDPSTGNCPQGMEYCNDPSIMNPVMRNEWDFLLSKTSHLIQQVVLSISWSCLFLYCSIVHVLDSLPATCLEVESSFQFSMYMPRCLKDEQKQAEVALLTVESVIRKSPALETVIVKGEWTANADVLWILTRTYASGYFRGLKDMKIVNYDVEQPYHTGVFLADLLAGISSIKRLTVVTDFQCSAETDIPGNNPVFTDAYKVFVLSTWQAQELVYILQHLYADVYADRFEFHFEFTAHMFYLKFELELTRMHVV